jgi:hypothetical protein
VSGHIRQRLAHCVRYGGSDGHRDSQRTTPGTVLRAYASQARNTARDLEVDHQTPGAHLSGDGLDAPEQAAIKPPARLVRIAGITERILHQRYVVPATAHRLTRVALTRTGKGGERVEHRVVQQALMLATFDVPGQNDVVLAGVLIRLLEGGVSPGGPAVEHLATAPVHGGGGEQQRRGRG